MSTRKRQVSREASTLEDALEATSCEKATWKRRWAGVAGLCGALLFFAGDMLFYGHWGSGAGFHDGMLATVRNASLERIFAGGLVGPFAACLCMVGFWHVYLNVRPSPMALGQALGRTMLVLFAVLMVFGSAGHALWTTRGLALKFCYASDDVGCRALLPAINSYWSVAYNLGAIPGYGAVLVLLSPLADKVPAPLGAVLVGGVTNLSIALFFLVSAITTWRRAGAPEATS